MIVCTCGHEVDDYADTAAIVLKQYCPRNGPYISYVVYCKPCADKAAKNDEVLFNEEDIDNWFNQS